MISPRMLRMGGVAALLLGVLLSAGCRTVTPPNSLKTHDSAKWEKDIAKFEASDRTNPPPRNGILFIGSSSIRLWTNLVTDFPGKPVFNRGFGGSQLADSVNYAERIVIPYAPRQVVIYAGGNDLNAKKTPAVVYGDFVALVKKIRAKLPNTAIAYISIAPNPKRWEQRNEVQTANRLISEYCERHGLSFINVYPHMLGPDGLPKPDIFLADKLHMNLKGYAIWREVVTPYLR